MQNIDRRVSKLETASGIKDEVYLLRVGDQTLESAVERWMARNPGRGDPRDWAQITVMHVKLAGPPKPLKDFQDDEVDQFYRRQQ